MNKSEVLSQAADLLAGDRETDYGDAVTNHERIAALWSAFLGVDVTASQVAVCMALLKISRLAHQADHQDSFVDGAAYLAIAGEASVDRDVAALNVLRGELGVPRQWDSLDDVPEGVFLVEGQFDPVDGGAAKYVRLITGEWIYWINGGRFEVDDEVSPNYPVVEVLNDL